MLARTLVPLALACPSVALADITVYPDGSVGPVVGLSQALELASPGETLFLMPGDYAGVDIVRQSVRIVGAGKDLVRIGTPEGSALDQNLRISEISFDQEVFLSGVTLDQRGLTHGGPTVSVRHCEGSVAFHDLLIQSTTIGMPATLEIILCSSMLLDRCEVLGAVAPADSGLFGSIAASTQESRVLLNHCRFVGGSNAVDLFGSSSLAALTVIGNWVRIHGGEILGGETTEGLAPLSGFAGNAVSVTGGTVEFSGGFGTLVKGSDGYVDPNGVVAGAPAITLTLGGTAVVYGGPTLVGGTGGDGIVAEAFDTEALGIVSYIAGAQHRPGLRTEPAFGEPGSEFDLIVEGTPDRTQFIYFAAELKRAYGLPGFVGLALLEPTLAELQFTPTVDAEGVATLPIAVPNELALIGQAGWFQSYEVQSPGPTLRLGIPTAFNVR